MDLSRKVKGPMLNTPRKKLNATRKSPVFEGLIAQKHIGETDSINRQ